MMPPCSGDRDMAGLIFILLHFGFLYAATAKWPF